MNMRHKHLWVIVGLFAFAGVAWAHVGHEHTAPEPVGVQWGLKGLQEVQNVHPLFVHFPIALLFESSALYLLGSVFRKNELLTSGKWTLYFGTLATAVTVWTGLQAAKTVPHDATTHPLMMIHQYFAFTVLGLSFLLSAWVFFSKTNIPLKGKAFFLLGLLLLDGILMQGADFGGRMVFVHGVGVGRKNMTQETNKDSHHHENGREDESHQH